MSSRSIRSACFCTISKTGYDARTLLFDIVYNEVHRKTAIVGEYVLTFSLSDFSQVHHP